MTRAKKPIKLFWWRLSHNDHEPQNFGDEITRLIIKKVFKRDYVWAPASTCDMIGAGSILAEVYETKADNKPFVWTSGFIEARDLTVPINAFQFCAVRGELTRSRIVGENASNLRLGDAGLLASYLLPTLRPRKKYLIGIVPHYKDLDTEFIRALSHRPEIHIIDPTRPCLDVIKDIYRCKSIISSSLHGLIVADSLGIPNRHVAISDRVEGGDYKFKDYYSAFCNSSRYAPLDAEHVVTLSSRQLYNEIAATYILPEDLPAIKRDILESFPVQLL